ALLRVIQAPLCPSLAKVNAVRSIQFQDDTAQSKGNGKDSALFSAGIMSPHTQTTSPCSGIA
ncbi:hypothetical protein ACNQ62_16690, partial [Sulfitobacter sp. SBS6]|uniref:hypothetical protein n=1 Tax=Sulfitobacter sp. SBS6 TaxID=3401755 RepID=UPI003AAB9BF2